jgi:multiple sugar transport system substrate-binding protein
MPSPIPTAPTAKDEQVTTRFAVYDWQQVIYKSLIKAFEEANPDLHIQLVSLDAMRGSGLPKWPDSHIRQFSSADVVYYTWVGPEMTRMGLVRDLTPLIEADRNFQPDDFYPGTLEMYQWDGGTWALPLTVDYQLICYHKEAFDEAGVPYPEPGWTWDDLAAKARALTVRQGDQVTRWGFALTPEGDNPGLLIEGQAGPLIDTTTDPPTPRFDRPEVIEAVRWYTDLFQEGVMTRLQPQEMSDGRSKWDPRTLYTEGPAAMWVDSLFNWQWGRSWGRIGCAPFPVDAPSSWTTPVSMRGRSIAMSAGTQHPDAAWRWMDFLSRQAVRMPGPFQDLPARRSVAEASGFWDRLDEELAEVLRYAVDHSYTICQEPEYFAVHRTLGRALRAILAGEKSVEEAMAEAQAQAMADIREYLDRLAQITPVPPFVVTAPEEKPIGEEMLTITFTPGMDPRDLHRYRQLAQRFHESHPDISVEVKLATSPYPWNLQGLAEATECFIGYPSLHDPKNREAILNLEPLLEADPSFAINDFYSQVLEQFTWQGQLWGLPAEVEPYVVEYNKDLFDAADLDYPPLDWTPDDFLALAVALTQGGDDDKQYGFVPEAYEGNALPLILERLGARLIDRSIDPLALSFDDPATIEALRWYAELATVHSVRPVFMTDLAELKEAASFYTKEALINEGRAAMWTTTSYESAMALGCSGLNIGVAPLPMGQGGSGSYLSARGYFISARAENPQACWQWIAFLSGQPEAVQGLPARRSVAESEAYRQQVGEERVAAYLTSVAGLERPFQIFSEESWLRGAIYWLFQAYGQVLKGEASVEEALGIAQRMADDYRACVMARDAFSDRGGWQACLIEVDPTLPDFVFEADEGE